MQNWSRTSALLALVLACTAMAPVPAIADVPMPGTFLATAACPAQQSFNKGTNPGNVTLQPQQTYQMLSANKMPASHYLLIVPGADPDHRWVAISCGTVLASSNAISTLPAEAPASTPAVPAAPAAKAGVPTHYVLSLSWEPAFCANHGAKPECAGETSTTFDASHFTLHGLWPDPLEYCGAAPSDIAADKADRWSALPAIDLSATTRAHLDGGMPGTKSLLERHEWLKHGTCSGAAADRYFGRALTFLDAVNASPVRDLVAGSVGRQVSLDALRAAFDKGFGSGAGARIRLSCPRVEGQRLITEITIGLDGDVMGDTALPALIAGARPTNGGCDVGTVAAAP